MDRRSFIRYGTQALLAGAVTLLVGCGRAERVTPGMGNQEKLWNIVAGIETTEQPLEPSYSQGTPAFFRDASLGKVDPSFVPRVGGG